MRLTILTQYFPPETGAPQNRLSDMARRLAGRGHQVEVLTALPNYPGNYVRPEYVGREYLAEVLDGVRVVRVGLYVPQQQTMVRRLANYLSFAANARRHGPRLLARADILLMESPPLFLALAGVYLARRLKAQLVTNVSDLWPKAVFQLGIRVPLPARFALERLEAWMYRQSTLITAQTEGIVEDIRRRVPNRPVELFPNGVDAALYVKPFDRAGGRREFGWGDDLFVVGYTGVFGASQALDQVLDAAAALHDLPRVHFALFGDGAQRFELERRIRDQRLVNTRIYPHQPGHRMPYVQAALDAGLVPLADTPANAGARPSKMFEFMAAGLPIVLCARGEAERIVRGPKGGPAGVVAPPQNPHILARRIRELVQDPTNARAMGRRGRDHVLAHFDREAIVRRLETDLLAAIKGSSA